ncbi:hypothetical protein N499_1391A, partial [Wolbachia pipientis wVitA]
MISSVILPVI